MTQTSAQYQDLSRFSKNLKRVYSNQIGDLTPTEDLASKLVPFTDGAEKVGDVYQMPFMMTREGGFTFKGGSGSGGVYTLNAPRAYATERAEISGCETTGRTAVSYKTITSAMGGDKRSFVSATKQAMARLIASASFFREHHIIYGGGASQVCNLGTVESVTDNTGTIDVVLTAATWCTARWAGSEGLEFDGYSSANAKRNTAGTDAAGDTVYKLTTVTPSTRTLRFSSANANTAALVATDYLVFATAYQQEALGLLGACQTSGSLWGINNSDYYLWKPKAVSVGGAMGYEKLQEGLAKVSEIGWTGTMHVLVNPYTWQDICDDMSSLIRITDKTSGEVTFGIDKPTFKGQTGTVKLHAYKYMNQGEALGIPGESCMRVGSTDITLDIPSKYGDMVMHLPNSTGVEFRCFDDQAPFCDAPGALIRWSGIVNRKSAA